MLQHKADLLQLRTGEALNEFGHGDPVFQVFKQGSHLDPGAAENPGSLCLPRPPVDGCCFSALAACERKLARFYL